MAHKDIGELSKGYRQRVGLAQALLADPPVLILDEPTSGLDPAQIVEIRELIKEIAHEKAILLSTHILPEAQNTCNRILIINEGRIVGEGTAEDLLAMSSGEEHYTLALKGGSVSAITDGLSDLPRVMKVEMLHADGVPRFRVSAEGGAQLAEPIFDFAVAQGLKLLELTHAATSLEDVFLKLTGGSGEGVILSERHHKAAGEQAAAEDSDSETMQAGGGKDE